MYGDIPAEGITIRVPNPPKTAHLRLPTNQETLDRLALQKSIRRNMGRSSLKSCHVITAPEV